jgi:hypothetical protein
VIRLRATLRRDYAMHRGCRIDMNAHARDVTAKLLSMLVFTRPSVSRDIPSDFSFFFSPQYAHAFFVGAHK